MKKPISDEEIVSLYKKSATEMPPVELDDKILGYAKAQSQLQSEERETRKRRWKAWPVIGLAASALLVTLLAPWRWMDQTLQPVGNQELIDERMLEERISDEKKAEASRIEFESTQRSLKKRVPQSEPQPQKVVPLKEARPQLQSVAEPEMSAVESQAPESPAFEVVTPEAQPSEYLNQAQPKLQSVPEPEMGAAETLTPDIPVSDILTPEAKSSAPSAPENKSNELSSPESRSSENQTSDLQTSELQPSEYLAPQTLAPSTSSYIPVAVLLEEVTALLDAGEEAAARERLKQILELHPDAKEDLPERLSKLLAE